MLQTEMGAGGWVGYLRSPADGLIVLATAVAWFCSAFPDSIAVLWYMLPPSTTANRALLLYSFNWAC